VIYLAISIKVCGENLSCHSSDKQLNEVLLYRVSLFFSPQEDHGNDYPTLRGEASQREQKQ